MLSSFLCHSKTARLFALVCFLVAFCHSPAVFSESLFTARVDYSTPQPILPRSLYTFPRPQHVGDTITITIKEQNTQEVNARGQINRVQSVTDSGTGLFNNAVKSIVGKIPFVNGKVTNGIANLLSVPSFDGLRNNNQLRTDGVSTQQTKLTQNVGCEVVQVLPNGYLVVQGHKTMMMNKERQDLVITGIVNPYFINRNNEIDSNRVANLQILAGGKGPISRQQGDSTVNKIQQFY
jgi:flagellar L-ring protein FlgH